MAKVNLIESSRRRKAHELRFCDLVVTLTYFDCQWKYFNETLRFLCQSELTDVLEERCANKKCGYVTCENELKIHPTASVSLDIPDKKIYDISRRKKFCSDWCYAAFKFIEDQLPEDPLWKKERVKLDDFKQYPLDGKGCKGEVYFEEDSMDIIKERIPISTKNDTINIHTDNTPIIKENVVKIGDGKKAAHKKNEIQKYLTKEDIDKNDKIDKCQNIIKAFDKIAINKKMNLDEVLSKVKQKSMEHQDRKLIFLNDDPLDRSKQIRIMEDENSKTMLSMVSSSLTEWITKKTQIFLNSKDVTLTFENMELNENGDTTKFHVMPSVDSVNQVIIRRSIILRRIQSCAAPILADMGLEDNIFHTRLIQFMKTCKLSSCNILFGSQALKLLIIVLVEILFPTVTKFIFFDKGFFLKKYKVYDLEYYEEVLMKINAAINDVTSDDDSAIVDSHGDF